MSIWNNHPKRIALLLSAAMFALPAILVLVVPHPLDQPFGVDFILYRDAAARWLAGGPYFEPYQLAGHESRTTASIGMTLFRGQKDSIEDRVKGLDLGADDYLVKPFQLPELVVVSMQRILEGLDQTIDRLLPLSEIALCLGLERFE